MTRASNVAPETRGPCVRWDPRDVLDALTDAVVPAAANAAHDFGLTMTVEDREALSDWLQDRFRLRAECLAEGGAA